MRISFLGKGGSGKTTLASAFIKYLASNNQFVLAIDADVNSHLHESLQFEQNPLEIGGKFLEIGRYLRGNRLDLDNCSMVATTPPAVTSNFIRLNKNDGFLQKYSHFHNNITLINIGTYQSEDVGHTCYHGKLNTLELILHHLLDTKTDFVVADATTGIDNLGTSLFMAYDLNVFVVEPTLKSVKVYKDFVQKSSNHNLNTKVVINKFQASDQEFIDANIAQQDILGYIDFDSQFGKYEQGQQEYFDQFIANNQTVFESIVNYLKTLDKDWESYLQKLVHAHNQNSLEWWDDYYGQPISQQASTVFKYQSVL